MCRTGSVPGASGGRPGPGGPEIDRKIIEPDPFLGLPGAATAPEGRRSTEKSGAGSFCLSSIRSPQPTFGQLGVDAPSNGRELDVGLVQPVGAALYQRDHEVVCWPSVCWRLGLPRPKSNTFSPIRGTQDGVWAVLPGSTFAGRPGPGPRVYPGPRLYPGTRRM
jgi:hypothetical protein